MTTAIRPHTLLDSAFTTIQDAVARGHLPAGVLALATSDELLRH